MTFNYEQSIWGRGMASLNWSDPTRFRLRRALLVLKNLPVGAKVLEIGCGAGQFIRAIKKMRPDLNCYGADISNNALEIAKKSNDGVKYVLNTEEKMPFGDKEFDVVLIFDVLEHVSRPDDLLKEARRILKLNGILHAFVPCESDVLSLWHWLDKFRLKHNLTTKHAGHIQFWSRRDLFALVIAQGFKVERVRYSEHFFGQILGVAVFWLMERFGRRQNKQINNEIYFDFLSGGSIISVIKKFVNFLVNTESVLWQCLPSPNVNLTARRIL